MKKYFTIIIFLAVAGLVINNTLPAKEKQESPEQSYRTLVKNLVEYKIVEGMRYNPDNYSWTDVGGYSGTDDPFYCGWEFVNTVRRIYQICDSSCDDPYWFKRRQGWGLLLADLTYYGIPHCDDGYGRKSFPEYAYHLYIKCGDTVSASRSAVMVGNLYLSFYSDGMRSVVTGERYMEPGNISYLDTALAWYDVSGLTNVEMRNILIEEAKVMEGQAPQIANELMRRASWVDKIVRSFQSF
ncbi:MAG: hypothetical protein WC575_01240 [Patescibacteria group bacterium]